MSPKPTDSGSFAKCAHCGRPVSVIAKRCYYCGAIKGRQCPECKAILPVGARICRFCSAPVPSGTPDYVPAGGGHRAETEAVGVTPARLGHKPPSLPRRKSRVLRVVIGIALLLIIALAAYVWRTQEAYRKLPPAAPRPPTAQPKPPTATAPPSTAPQPKQPAGVLPIPGWTYERRRVKVATPEGQQWKDITYYKNTIGMEFVKIPVGEFMMGSPREGRWHKSREGPRNRVAIEHPFFISAHEVTNAQYRKFRPKHNSGIYEPVAQTSPAGGPFPLIRAQHRPGCDMLRQ